MKKIIITQLLAVALIYLLGCQDREEFYPNEPRLEFVEIKFEESIAGSKDTLMVTFSITDGDLDFGLDNSNIQHLEFPYQDSYFYLRRDGSRVSSDKVDRGEIEFESLIHYEDRFNPPYDTLTDDQCRYVNYQKNDSEFAFLFTERNENAYNIFVDFFVQNLDGSYSEFDWSKEFCITFDGRIPSTGGLPLKKIIRSGPFFIEMESARKGRITYMIVFYEFHKIFGSKKMKLQLRAQDRGFNKSNNIETPEFFLDDI